MCVFVSQWTSLLVEKAVKIGSSNYHFVTTDLVVIKMGKSAFDKIVHACFGKVAHPNYMDTITKFENGWFEMYIEFDIPYINKAHIIITHVPQVLQRTGSGLFFQSEEVLEATHSKFDIFWQRYKVIEVESEKHG